MIQKIRIQNFRSIQDATVELGKVNLFIGPNNSGKSNMLKGIELMAGVLKKYPEPYSLLQEDYQSLSPRSTANIIDKKEIIFSIQMETVGANLIVPVTDNFELLLRFNNKDETRTLEYNPDTNSFSSGAVRSPFIEYGIPGLVKLAKDYFDNVVIHKIDPSKFQLSTSILKASYLESNGSNIISFLFELSQNHKKRFQQLEADLAVCVVDLVSLSTPADPNEPGKLKLKFFDTQDRAFWAEEVSEGVLYFLALLCIVHQPDPPKLLLIEEPEKGIHPRRIREVMDFIFQLAEERDIQIIITSHSPYVVDHFADIPECISVFDKEEGATVIRNAARDILEPLNERNAEQNLPPVQYTDSLGEHWVSGFLGGVPL